MDATTKYQKTTSKKKLIKLNKKRTIFISIITFILLLSIVLGLYFGLRSKLPKISAQKISVETSLKKVENLETDEKMGIIFASPECHFCNFLLYNVDSSLNSEGGKEIKKQKEAEGVFNQYLNDPSRKMDWFMVEGDTISDSKENIDNFFIADQESTGASPFDGAAYLGSLRDASIDKYNSSKQSDVSIEIVSSDTEELSIVTNITPDDTAEGGDIVDGGDGETTTSPGFAVPLLLWFEGTEQGGKLSYFTMGVNITSTTEETSVPSPTVKTFLTLESEDAFLKLGSNIS